MTGSSASFIFLCASNPFCSSNVICYLYLYTSKPSPLYFWPPLFSLFLVFLQMYFYHWSISCYTLFSSTLPSRTQLLILFPSAELSRTQSLLFTLFFESSELLKYFNSHTKSFQYASFHLFCFVYFEFCRGYLSSPP